MPDSVHGTPSGYTYWNCRCKRCNKVAKAFSKTRTRKPRPKPDPSLMPNEVHGTSRGYTYWGCRCDPCRAAARRPRAFLAGGSVPVPGACRQVQIRGNSTVSGVSWKTEVLSVESAVNPLLRALLPTGIADFVNPPHSGPCSFLQANLFVNRKSRSEISSDRLFLCQAAVAQPDRSIKTAALAVLHLRLVAPRLHAGRASSLSSALSCAFSWPAVMQEMWRARRSASPSSAPASRGLPQPIELERNAPGPTNPGARGAGCTQQQSETGVVVCCCSAWRNYQEVKGGK